MKYDKKYFFFIKKIYRFQNQIFDFRLGPCLIYSSNTQKNKFYTGIK